MGRVRISLLALLIASPALAQVSGGGGGSPAGGGSTSASVNTGPIAVTPTVSASAYTANYAIGGLQTVSIFRTAAQPSGILNYVGIESKGGLTTSFAIYAFTKSPASTCTNNAAFVLSSSDVVSPGFPITLTPATTAGTTQSTASTSINLSEKNSDSSLTTNMYFCAVSLGTPTPASTTDLIFTYTMLQD